MSQTPFNIKGLSNQEVLNARNQFGNNQLTFKKTSGFIEALKSIFKEPMVILLLVAAAIYFITGNIGDGSFLAAAIILVAAISLFQDARSRQALEKLEAFTQPYCKVIRDNQMLSIHIDELVIGDFILAEEGSAIAADGNIIKANDFSVNESILTGETYSVSKNENSSDNKVYRGTYVVTGLAVIQITAIGNDSKLGKIGKSLESIGEEKTPLEKQINRFVQHMAIIGTIVFLIVWFINFKQSDNMLSSLLQALTLAMSILPEEIPVAFTTFMALGAWRLMKMGIVVKQMKTVETLGSATVICTDKTGTLTENKMSIGAIYNSSLQKTIFPDEINQGQQENDLLIKFAMWASEPIPFDPMEIALHQLYKEHTIIDDRPFFKMIHEYPLDGRPPMMTHIFENESGQRIIAAKGAPEAIFACSNANNETRLATQKAINEFTAAGFRVLAVGEALFSGTDFPTKQQDFLFNLLGIVAFYDPPKENMKTVLNQFYQAGIKVKIITGDNAATTKTIANKIGFRGSEKQISGEELMLLSDQDLKERVAETALFTRMFPEAKLKIINALKSNNEIVAMTGDGVNDGPALKAAHIGIAMGKKGTEIAKEAASLILINDDLAKMVDAVAIGRKIYTNLKKAIQYIISIHIPIVLTVFIPLVLGWIYPNIFTPVHVIFLELIMGPTCSIIYENEPIEKNSMSQLPRPFTSTFFSWRELATSVVQGLAITMGTLYIYQYAVRNGFDLNTTRTMVFCCLVFANIFLTLENRSFYFSIFTTIRYKNNLVLWMIVITLLLLLSLIYIPPFAHFFDFESINLNLIGICFVVGSVSVLWFEIMKALKNNR